MIVGRVALALDPGALTATARGRTVVLVSGTNGKTTTSHLVAGALRQAGAVAHNASGSNMADGALTALLECRDAQRAVLEVDELHLAEVADAVDPNVIVLLNLTRDQLDRVSEVRGTADAIADVLRRHQNTTVVANADDPLTTWAASTAGHVEWVAAGAGWSSDAASCPSCGEMLTYAQGPSGQGASGQGASGQGPSGQGPSGQGASGQGASGQGPSGMGIVGWHCPGCGLARPEPAWWWNRPDPTGPATGHHHHTGNPCPHDTSSRHSESWNGPLRTALPGRINLSNALMALAAADAIGVAPDVAAPGVGSVQQVAGRYAVRPVGQHRVRQLLVKNPAGWVEALDVLGESRPLLLVINSRQADGRDVSWLWDLPVGSIADRPIAVAGERAADLGVRLSYAGIPHRTDPDPLVALATLPAGAVDVVANYTAFHDLRARLGKDDS